MAKIFNNRVYLECEIEFDAYLREIQKVIELGLEKYVVIWDQSKFEEKNNDIEIFDVYISPNRINDEGIKIFDRNIWSVLLKKNLHRTKLIKIGCWKREEYLINEINSVCKIVGVEEYDEQIEFLLEINEPTKDYLINRYLDFGGNIKWFNLGLYGTSNRNCYLFYSSHWGEEIDILGLTAEEVEESIAAIENNDIYVRINRHKSSICENTKFES